jgi:hypothetical protein
MSGSFFFDGIGALTSAFLLGIILVKFESYFGIPKNTLYLLASIPCVFAVYDFYCYFRIKNKLGQYLKGIAVANVLYCFLSIGLASHHSSFLTSLGWVYIIGEVVIILILVTIELRASNNNLPIK